MTLDADEIGLAGRADIGRVLEDFRHAERAPLAVKLLDREAADTEGRRGEDVVDLHQTGIERHRRREDLEGRTHLERAAGHAVQVLLPKGIDGIVRIVIRERSHGDHLAGLGVEDDTAGRDRLVALHGGGELVAHDVLDAQVDRQVHRLQIGAAGQAGVLDRAIAAVVDILLHAGDALIVDVHMADDVGRGAAARIEAPLLGAEADAGDAERMDLLLLARGDLALQPGKAGFARQAGVQHARVEIGQHRHQEFGRLIGIDDAARLGEQRGRADVGGQNLAVAVEKIGTRRRPLCKSSVAGLGIGVGAPDDQTPADHHVDGAEKAHRQHEARPVARRLDALATAQAGARRDGQRRGAAQTSPELADGGPNSVHRTILSLVTAANPPRSTVGSGTRRTGCAGSSSGATICSGAKGRRPSSSSKAAAIRCRR